MATNIEGLLRNMKGRKINCIDDDDNTLSDREARNELGKLLAQGHKLIPSTNECIGFDPFGKGCPGHLCEEHYKILHLTIKKRWFDMIASGEKKEEYRDIKPYWNIRLFNKDGSVRDYDIVKIRNGYSPDSPFIYVEFKGLKEKEGREEWGAASGVKYYCIQLGDILKTQ